MRLLTIISLVLTLGWASASANAQQSAFAPFAGQWAGTGRFQGAPSEVTATFAPLFDGMAWSLDIDVRFTPPGRPTARFAGRGAYALRAGALSGGSWVDSFGNAYAISPRLEEDALVVDWGSPPNLGRSEYRIMADGNLRIEDFVQAQDGQWRSFALAELQRTEN